MGGNRIRPANVTIVKTFQKSLDTVLGTSAMDILAIDEDRNASLLIRRKSACSTDYPGRLVLMSFTKKFARQPRALIVAEMAATLFVIAAFDFVSFQFHGGSPNWDEQAAIHLYRIAQEAINNATRHGKARNILVFLEAADHSISLRVLDDGVGVSESRSEGMGLRIMRYRAQSIGGEVTVERRNGPGTTVSCTVRTNSQVNEIAAA